MFAGILLWIVYFWGAATLMHGQIVPAGPPDAVFYNGKVVTVDSGFSVRQAFAVKGDRFLATGSNAEMRALAGKETRLVDLHGRTVIPGLMDNHNHLYRAVTTMLRGFDMMGVKSLPELLDRLRKAVSGAKAGEPLVAGGGWDPRFFPEKRGPTRAELDQISPDKPLVVVRSRQQFYLNSAALRAAGITRDTKDIAGVPVPKDAQGEPTGVLNDQAATAMVSSKLIPPMTEAEKRELMMRAQRIENEAGLTSIRELSLTPDVMRIYQEFSREGKLTLRVSMGIDTSVADADKLDEMLRPWGVGPGFGDDWLRLDSVAEFAVDSGVETAYLRAAHLGERPNYFGDIRLTAEKFRQAMLTIHRYGWRPAIHITGDKALDMALDAYEAADRVSSIRQRRWVVEHIPMSQADQMERMAKMGVLVSAQIQTYLDGPEMLKDWGRERAEHSVAVREWLDHKLSVSSGTDWPGRPLSPFLTIYFYVTRKTLDGTVIGPAEKISRQEALRLATVNNAYLTFEEKTKGSIEPGKLADFLVLSGDILTVPDEQILSLRPVATFVGGRKVFATPEGNSY